MNTQQLYQTALNHHREGQLVHAETCYRQLLALQPDNAGALHLLGVLCHQTNRANDAIALITSAIKIEPRNTDYMNNYGLALKAIGQHEQAIDIYKKALQIAPKDLDLQTNLANTYQALERYEEAAGCYRRVLHANPHDVDVRQALCYALQKLGNQGQKSGNYLQAEACYEEAIKLNFKDAALYYNLGNAQRALGKSAEAANNYSKSLALNPNDADTHNNLGNVLRELGRIEDAIKSYRAALSINPKLFHAKVHLVHQKQHICDWRNLEKDVLEIRAWVKSEPQAQISPFAFLAMPGTNAQEQLQCANNWLQNRYKDAIQYGKSLAFAHTKESRQKLRIGYLSGDFRLHPLVSLITEMIELHDRDFFEVYAYSYARDDKSAERKRLEQAFDHFTDISPFTQYDAAKRIHEDQIDILVDLTGFTQNSRTGIVALKPAAIHVSWLGFPGSMGAIEGSPLFDYLLTDTFITPKTQEGDYAERFAYLPDSYQPNDRKRPIGKTPSRTDYDLPEDAFVFCCFNQSFKILPDVFDVWMRILQAVPDSVLWLLECNTAAKINLQAETVNRGIEANRLVFAPRVPMADHLARHALADLFLDTLPYNAHTTTSDALWMCLPVLTCSGETFPSRVAASLLHAAGLPELVTQSLDDYASLAIRLAQDASLLESIRGKLQQPSESLPLFNTPVFTRNLEQNYQQMWQAYISE
ncbi:MAG: tetratricopeptide repeat protein [Methylophilaceae bacterium]